MASIARVKERAEEQSTSMSTDQQSAIRMLANDLHRLNQSVMNAVEAGVSVELVRSARHHGGEGNWGSANPGYRYPKPMMTLTTIAFAAVLFTSAKLRRQELTSVNVAYRSFHPKKVD